VKNQISRVGLNPKSHMLPLLAHPLPVDISLDIGNRTTTGDVRLFISTSTAAYSNMFGTVIDVESMQAWLRLIQKSVTENRCPMPNFLICQDRERRAWDAIAWLESGSCDAPTMPA
jgi:hypothetical protein